MPTQTLDDILPDKPKLTFEEVAEALGKHIFTVRRWHSPGILAPDGQRRRLWAIKTGGRWMTTRTSLAEFFEALTGAPVEADPPPRTPGQRDRACAAAQREIEASCRR